MVLLRLGLVCGLAVLHLGAGMGRAQEFRPDSLTSPHFFQYHDEAGLERAIAAGAGVNHQDSMGITPLLNAIYNGSTKAVQILLDHGALISVADDAGNTPLHAAVSRRGSASQLVSMLLAHPDLKPDDLNKRNSYGMTPLMVALVNSETGIARQLIEAGTDTSLRSLDGKRALDYARAAKASAIVAMLEPPAPKPAANTAASAKPAAKAEATAAAAESGASFSLPDHPRIASDLLSGKPYDFDTISQAVTAGVATTLLEECRVDLTTAERLEVADFVKSATLAAAMGTDYSNPDLGKTFASQQAGIAQYTAGVVAVRTMGCTGNLPSQLARQILETVRYNRKGSDRKAVFLQSCSNRHNAATCDCVLTQGMAVDANLAGQTYSQDLIQGLIERNPMIGMVMIMQCGLTEY